MKHFVALIAGVALGASTLGTASADQTFGAGRNGANGMSDGWSRPSENLERYGSELETKEDDAAPLGAGRLGADGMSDPAYRSRPFGTGEPFGIGRPGTIDPAEPKNPRPFGAGDAPIDQYDRTSDDQSVPNGH